MSAKSDSVVGWVRSRVRFVARRVRGCLPSPRATPFAAAMLATLGVTALLLRFHAIDADGVVSSTSTNVHNLARHPIESLITSAFVVTDGVVPQLLVVAIAFAAFERVVGTRLAAAVAWSGHVIATLATEIMLGLGIRAGVFAFAATQRPDVGISYAMYSVAAACASLLPGRKRLYGLGVVIGAVVVPFAIQSDLTAIGHLLSVAFGLAAAAALKRRSTISGHACARLHASRPQAATAVSSAAA